MWKELKEILGFVAFVLVVTALVSGVTYKGKHYGLSCDSDHGVVIEMGETTTTSTTTTETPQ